MTGRVVHFEVPADDVNRAKEFYHQAFGWQLRTMPELDYTTITTTQSDQSGRPTEAGAINGGMMQRMPGFGGAVVTIEVDDVDAALTKVEGLGGKTLVSKQSVGDMGFAGYFADTEGNVIGLWQNA
jgi:predicted enzyme related to lactoylglutathione lyase